MILLKPNKSLFEYPQKQQGWSQIGILRLIGSIIEIGAIVGASILGAGAGAILGIGLAGSGFQFGLDTYQLINRQISGGQFALGTFVNFGSLAIPPLIKNVYNRFKTGAVAIKGYKNTRYIVKGASGYQEALNQTITNPTKYSRVSRFSVEKIIKNREVPLRYFEFQNDYWKAFHNEFGSGQRYYGAKDKSIIHDFSSKLARGQVKDIESINKLADSYWKKLTPQAQNTIIDKAIEQIEPFFKFNNVSVYSPLIYENIFKNANFTNFKYPSSVDTLRIFSNSVESVSNILRAERESLSLFNKFFRFWSSYEGHKWTQRVQRFLDPNNLARDVVKGATFHINKIARQAGKEAYKVAYDKKLGIFYKTKQIVGKNGQLVTKRIYQDSWLKRRLIYYYDEVKKSGGYLFKLSWIVGYQIVQDFPNSQTIRIFFNPEKTRGKTKGSKNIAGKAPLITTLPKAKIEAWKQAPSIGEFYLKGDGAWKPISVSAGGRRQEGVEEALNLLEGFLSFIPLQGLRNLLSVVSNVKRAGVQIIRGTFIKNFRNAFLPSFLRNATNRSGKLLGTFIASAFGIGSFGTKVFENLGINITSSFYQKGSKSVNGETSPTIKFGNNFNLKRFGTNFGGRLVKSYLNKKIPSGIKGRTTMYRRRQKKRISLSQYRRVYGIFS